MLNVVASVVVGVSFKSNKCHGLFGKGVGGGVGNMSCSFMCHEGGGEVREEEALMTIADDRVRVFVLITFFYIVLLLVVVVVALISMAFVFDANVRVCPVNHR